MIIRKNNISVDSLHNYFNYFTSSPLPLHPIDNEIVRNLEYDIVKLKLNLINFGSHKK